MSNYKTSIIIIGNVAPVMISKAYKKSLNINFDYSSISSLGTHKIKIRVGRILKEIIIEKI